MIDDDLSNFQRKQTDEGLELPGLVTHSRLCVIWDEPRKTVLAQAREDAMAVDPMVWRVHVRGDETTLPPVISASESLLLLG
jgi:hypothetical protein